MNQIKKLIKNEETLAQGHQLVLAADHPDFDLSGIFHFLGHYQKNFNSDLKQQLNGPAGILEYIRDDFRKSDLNAAFEKIENIKKQYQLDYFHFLQPNQLLRLLSEYQPQFNVEFWSEFLLEEARHQLLSGELIQSLQTSSSALALTQSELSKLTLHQMRMDTYIQLNNYDQAFEEFQTAKKKLFLFIHASSAFSTLGFAVKLFSEKKKFDLAAEILLEMRKFLSQIESTPLFLDRYLTYLRSSFFYFQVLEQPKKIKEVLCNSYFISSIIADTYTLEKTKNDLSLHQIEISTKNINSYNKFYVTEFNLLIDLDVQKLCRFKNNDLYSRILSYQNYFFDLNPLNSKIEIDPFFKKIWNINYNKEKHNDLIRITFSKMRKKLNICIAAKDGFIQTEVIKI